MSLDPLQQAYSYFHEGRLDEADESCRIVLDGNPDHMQANHLLGVIRFSPGQDRGRRRSAEARRRVTRGHSRDTQQFRRRPHETWPDRTGYRRVRTGADPQAPVTPDALNNLGVIYRDAKQTDRAIGVLRQAAELRPDLRKPKPISAPPIAMSCLPGISQ